LDISNNEQNYFLSVPGDPGGPPGTDPGLP